MAFPNAIPRARDRRKLGRLQSTPVPAATVTVTGASHVATLNFSGPVNAGRSIPLAVVGQTLISQTNASATQILIQTSGTLTGVAWSLPTPIPGVSTYQGGQALGGSGTF